MAVGILTPPATAVTRDSSELHLSVSGDCNAGQPKWIVVTAGWGYDSYCYHFPRVLVDNVGFNPINEHFESQSARSPYARPITPVRLDGSRPIKVVLSLSSDYQRGPIAADFTIRLQNVVVATVRVEATRVDPTGVTKTFLLTVPSRLRGARITTADVQTTWVTCIGPLSCSVELTGPDRSRIVLPIK
jgi:hypothetical protein